MWREWLNQLRNRFASRNLPGRRGERVAAGYLRKHGYRILGRNIRTRTGEIDIVALEPKGKAIVVVEVKSGSGGPIPPEAHVNFYKQRKLVVQAVLLAKRYRLTDRPFRIDVVAVDLPVAEKPIVRHYIGAVEPRIQ